MEMEAVARIHARGRFSGKPGLHRMQALCKALGNPQDKLKFIHLAGTNGKGSTAAMLASVFQCAGYRTGLYTSPYLVSFRERIRVNGRMIVPEALVRLEEQVRQAADTLELPEGEHIGEFEFVTALAFLYFAEQGCEVVVLETGLGGSYDATNVIAPPEAAVITSISLDHMAVLGNTIEEIARTKAGIYKPGSLHIAAGGQKIYDVLREFAPDLQIALPATPLKMELSGTCFVWEGAEYEIHLPGVYQLENAALALTTLQGLKARGWKLPQAAMETGLREAYIAGRMQGIGTNPQILLDGAHNIGGIQELCKNVKAFHRQGKIYAVLGMCADKATEQIIKGITFPVECYYLTPLQNERSLDPAALQTYLQHQQTVICTDCRDALRKAVKAASPEDFILVFGSLYLVGEVEKLLDDRKLQTF